ncbi:Uncharacterised protein [Mycobacteroides abscessus subsp. abscessus]|nr:Uncharacterised protein [Mycobacteroides abscessus subsp. abscessus]
MMRQRGTCITPLRTFIGCWHGKTSPDTQSMKTGSVVPTTSLSVRRAGTRGGVTATHSDGAPDVSRTTTRASVACGGASARGNRRFRHVGAVPTSSGDIVPRRCTVPPVPTRPNSTVTS